MNLPPTTDGAWFWVVEPDGGAYAPESERTQAGDGRVLTRRPHGYRASVEVTDASGEGLATATLLRAAAAAGHALEALGDEVGRPLRVRLEGRGTVARVEEEDDGVEVMILDGPAVAGAPIHHPVDAEVLGLLSPGRGRSGAWPRGELPARPMPRVLFFESLMNSDMPHNDTELSQGVLHMASTLAGTETEVVLVDVKMSITGQERPVHGLERLEAAICGGPPIGLVCITLLEGYYEGVRELIAELRRLGCRARVAVGGVMPTLTPEHVAAHLPDVSFVCRGAGEYFVSRLARILGSTSVDDALSGAQRSAFLEMDGLFVIERAGARRLLAANPARIVAVESLDDVELDLRHLTQRHLQNGIELSTSRGCIHKCSFCSILGRQQYQARTAGGVFALLERYAAHYRTLFGDEVPRNAYRVHISDDDFACDRARAKEFFLGLRATPFRLSSVQVSIADLCLPGGVRRTPEPDLELLDTIRPECFADVGAPIPARDFVADHRSRNWSSFLQIGVETFSDAELLRLAKGYSRAHIRAIVTELARRRIHMDAYFIQANADTSAEDLLDSLEELCRLKLRHPTWFHVRFPVVPHLVSYFPSASHRRILRVGKTHTLAVRSWSRVPSHPEFDYPFVDHDVPQDPWVRDAVNRGFFGDQGHYTGSLERVSALWKNRIAGVESAKERTSGERLVRRLDDKPRRLVFDLLAQARTHDHVSRARSSEWPGAAPAEAAAMATATEILGPRETWWKAFSRYVSQGSPRLVVIPTWQCELRCSYCWIPKQDGRVMPVATLERAIELLMSSERDELILQYFGGEALMEFDLVRHGIEYSLERGAALGKRVSFILSSNGWTLTGERLAWLARHPIKLELSLDGDRETQNKFRRSHLAPFDSYDNGIAPRANEILASGLRHEVIMVVHPLNVGRLCSDFFHIADLGFSRIQINFALGLDWTREQKESFAAELFRIGTELRRRWGMGERTALINLESKPSPMRLNGEVTVDWDGTVYGGNGFLHETEHRAKFVRGHLDDLQSFDRYWLDLPENEFLLEWSYPKETTKNNLEVGAIMTSFVRWMQTEPIGARAEAVAPGA